MAEPYIYEFIFKNPLKELVGRQVLVTKNDLYAIRNISYAGSEFSVDVERTSQKHQGEITRGATERMSLNSLLKYELAPETKS